MVFSWIVYKSRVHRDSVNAKVMKDPRIAGMCNGQSMPFDVKRMAYGGFMVSPSMKVRRGRHYSSRGNQSQS